MNIEETGKNIFTYKFLGILILIIGFIMVSWLTVCTCDVYAILFDSFKVVEEVIVTFSKTAK